MSVVRIDDSDLSPIYRKLYLKVAALPAFDNIAERMLQNLRDAKVTQVRYSKHKYSDAIQVYMSILLRGRVVQADFRAAGDDPHFSLNTDHLVENGELLRIFFENVGRSGQRIRPHGLVQDGTIRQGAEPRGKNAFAPWMRWRLFSSDSFKGAKERTKQRLVRGVQADLVQDPKFLEFSEEVQMEGIVNKLKQYSHLPPEILHRAIDLMYVEVTMER